MRYIKTFENFDDNLHKAIKSSLKYHASDEFWEFVERIDWENYDYNERPRRYDAQWVIPRVAPIFSWEEFQGFETEYKRLESYVMMKFESVWLGDPGIEVSDDGWTDLVSSVIGYGKKWFLSIIMDDSGSKLRQQGNSDNYRENFSYIFHILKFDDVDANRAEWNRIYNENNVSENE